MKAILNNLSPESRLIIGVCQTSLMPDVIETMRTLITPNTDWDYVIGVARRNAVLPLLSWNLLNHFSEQLPPAVKDGLHQELLVHTQRNLFLTQKVGELVRMFRKIEVEALPFKGPMLALQAYGNPALRKYGDLDILVRPRDFGRAVVALEANGYKPVTTVSWLNKTNWFISRKKDVYFVHPNQAVNLELHWKLSGSHFGLPKEMNLLWERLEAVNIGGTSVPALCFNDLLIYLCLHGSRHSWERFSWICDVNQLILSENEVDWDCLFTEARRLGCENVLALGLRLIHEFFGFDVPVPLWKTIKSESLYEGMVQEIRERLFSEEARPVTIDERYPYHLKLKERRSDKWKLHIHYLSWYLKIILTPNDADKNVINLPRLLYPVYFITRPVRLAFARLFTPVRESPPGKR
jgi:Uncharacterised nucleotidyltransferase